MTLKLPSDSHSSRVLMQVGGIFIALILVQFFLVLSVSWIDFKAYSYGFVAAPLACLLSWYRFVESNVTFDKTGQYWIFALMLFLCLSLIPIRMLERVDVFWRLPIWMHAVVVVLLIHLVVAFIWSIRRSITILPGTLLLFTAVPLPSVVESFIIGHLTNIVTAIDVEALVFKGYPIDLLGNTFLVNGNLLDVSEGCSGIRSFQGAIVTALLIGEFLSFTVLKRALLLCSSISLAIFFNALRIYILTATAFDQGPEAEQKIHDQVGWVTLFGIYGSIFLIAFFQYKLNGKNRTKKVVVRKEVL